MRTLPALTLAAIALSASAAPPAPLVEEKRIDFEAPFEDVDGNVCFHAEAPVGYAAALGRVVAFDARTGATLGSLALEPGAGRAAPTSWQLRNVGSRLLATSILDDGVALIDVDEPGSPRPVASAYGRWRSPVVQAVLADGHFVLGDRTGAYWLLSQESLDEATPIPHAVLGGTFFGAAASSGPGAAPFLVVVEGTGFSPQRTTLTAYDLVEGELVPRFSQERTDRVSSIVADRSGSTLVVSLSTPSAPFRRWIETLDASTGATLASWDVVSIQRIALAEGEGRRLLEIDPTGFDVVDLADPASPRSNGRIPLPPAKYRDARGVVPSVTAPFVVVSQGIAHEVAVYDLRTAEEISRFAVADGEAKGFVLQETPSGERRAAIAVENHDEERVFLRGGLSHLELADLSNPARPEATGRFLRNEPAVADKTAAIGPDHLLVYQVQRNALALVDLSAGRVAQVTGAGDRLGRFEDWSLEELATAGRIALLAGPGGWERFVLTRGRLETLDANLIPPGAFEGLYAATLTSTGTVVALGARYENGEIAPYLETVGLDGRSGRIPRVDARILRPSVSPRGDLLALARPEYYEPHGLDVYDVSDPASPRLLWSLAEDVNEAAFDPTGTRLLVSGPLEGSEFWIRVFDARSGVPFGPPSSGIWKFFYHGLGTQWIADGAWRAIYWNWDFLGWDGALVDLSGATPTLLRTYPDTGFAPEFAPRVGGGWYELLTQPWDRLSFLVVGAPDGETAATDVMEVSLSGIVAVRKGFVATTRSTKSGLGVSLWRDDALLRPPAQPIPKIGTASGGHR